MEKDYVLYGTSACHLCEMAEAILGPIIKRYSITFTKEDILEDDSDANAAQRPKARAADLCCS